VLAIFTNSFAERAYSLSFLDDVILYDFDNNIVEDNTTSRPGKIIYREDPDINLITFYDWRNVIFRRWNIKGFVYDPVTHSAGTTEYFVTTISFDRTEYQDFYINLGTDTHLASPTLNLDASQTAGEEREMVKEGDISFTADELLSYVTNATAWIYYSPSLDKYVVIDADVTGSDRSGGQYVKGYYSWRDNTYTLGNNHSLDVDTIDFVDYFTFGNSSNGGNLIDIKIPATNDDSYNNIIFIQNSSFIKQIQFGDNCSNMTFSHSNYESFRMKNDCFNNIITADTGYSDIDDEFQENLMLGTLLRYTKTQAESINNTWISTGNIYHHHYKGLLQNNTFRYSGSGISGYLYFDGYY
ncbi:MAG: hypothetical protein ACC656_14670, partial [Candidatus Heimdallarchaeota archaeon]